MCFDGQLKTPREKYRNDPAYRQIVNTIEHCLEYGQFTPSEIREACMLACINYEMRRVRTYFIPSDEYEQFVRDVVKK